MAGGEGTGYIYRALGANFAIGTDILTDKRSGNRQISFGKGGKQDRFIEPLQHLFRVQVIHGVVI